MCCLNSCMHIVESHTMRPMRRGPIFISTETCVITFPSRACVRACVGSVEIVFHSTDSTNGDHKVTHAILSFLNTSDI